MNPLNNPLEGFSPEVYLATLSELAHADGLQPIEQDLLQEQATTFGLDLASLPPVPEDLSHVPWSTRVLVYRDALMLALADSRELSPEEEAYLASIADRMRISKEMAEAIAAWVRDYNALLDTFMSFIEQDSP